MICSHTTMSKSLLSPEASEAVSLFRTCFAGFLDEVPVALAEEPLADFLAEEGILVKPVQGRPS